MLKPQIPVHPRARSVARRHLHIRDMPVQSVPRLQPRVRVRSVLSSQFSWVEADISQMTAELRTRLSYAMMKVNKGWESLPIEEVESLASQSASPASSTSTIQARRHLTSPRATIANIQGRLQDSLKRHNGIQQQAQAPYTSSQPSRKYESFWREQSQRQAAGVSPPRLSNHALAPPADVGSTGAPPKSRRSHTPRASKPPLLQTNTLSDLSQGSQVSAGIGPSTPSRHSHPVDPMMQAPTQKTVQEQDAIETLLFMSSPGNSSTMGHTFPASKGRASQLQSPLRADFGTSIHGSRNEGTELSSMPLSATNGRENFASRNRLKAHNAPRRLREEEIDRLLDSTPDPESSEEDVDIPITPRRHVTTGPA